MKMGFSPDLVFLKPFSTMVSDEDYLGLEWWGFLDKVLEESSHEVIAIRMTRWASDRSDCPYPVKIMSDLEESEQLEGNEVLVEIAENIDGSERWHPGEPPPEHPNAR